MCMTFSCRRNAACLPPASSPSKMPAAVLGARGRAKTGDLEAGVSAPSTRLAALAARLGARWRRSEARRAREAAPLQPRLQACLEMADAVVEASPGDREAQVLRDWVAEIQGFARLFDRALRALARAGSDEIARGFAVLARLPDESLDRLLGLFGSLPEEELARTLDAISRVSPATARRILTTADRVARLGR